MFRCISDMYLPIRTRNDLIVNFLLNLWKMLNLTLSQDQVHQRNAPNHLDSVDAVAVCYVYIQLDDRVVVRCI